MIDIEFSGYLSTRDGLRFQYLNHSIWKARDNWRVASFGDNGAHSHRNYNDLEEAILDLLKRD